MSSDNSPKSTFLTQLRSIDTRSREFPSALTKMLASPEGENTAISLQGDDALTLVDILDQVFEAPDMEVDLRTKSFRVLRRVCGSNTILPRSCILSEISKEGDIAIASRGLADVWSGRHNGDRVCIKTFRVYTAENLSKVKQCLFQEIVVWRRLSHLNVLPVLGVSPKLFPLCIVSKWMANGNIIDFTSKHPEVNRLRLLAETASGLQYLHSIGIKHSDLKPTNILIDRDFHPRLTDYGLTARLPDPMTVDPAGMASPFVNTVRYMAPELLDPSSFGLKNSNTTKKSDIYAFGMVTYQVTTGQQPFPGAHMCTIMHNVVLGGRPDRPHDRSGWFSDDVWNLISRCWSSSWEGRPDVNHVMGALNGAADAVEARPRKLHATTDDQGKRTPRRQFVAFKRYAANRGKRPRRSNILPHQSDSTGEGVKGQPPIQQNSLARQPSQTSVFPETSTIQAEPWEDDLIDFLRACKTGTGVNLEGKKAQEFVDKLDAALDKGVLEGKQNRYLKDLRKLCRMFGILPSSFMLIPTFDEPRPKPFAGGGFSEVYEATLGGRRVAVKALRIPGAESIQTVQKLLVKEVAGWKWVRHENILPFVGVSLEPSPFSIISERMENGNITNFIKAHPNYNRLRLLAGAVTGLIYLHDHGIVHGDLKGVNILVDSECCARLGDFGLAVVIDESISGSVAENRALGGTYRWMAPELLLPENFGFTRDLLKRLPSMSTDIYAIGMTILEVLTGRVPFSDSPGPYNVMYKVIKGDRPSRPASGFSGTLWKLLVATWVVEDGPESKRRPSASAVLDRLQKDVDNWGKSIVPLVPEEWKRNGSDTASGWAEADDQDKAIQRGPISPGITDRFKEFFRLG